jgi:histidinol-phosphate/aromatic aminotransferase/cobyric acid decarboxylase-like protein
MVVVDAGFHAQSLTALVQQANGTQRVDLGQDAGANTLEITLSDVLAADRDVLVVTAGSNDVVRLDTAAWVDTGQATTVGDHTYALWAYAGAHLLIDTQASVQQLVV